MSCINGIIVPSITFFGDKFENITQLNSILFRHIVLNGANAILLFRSNEQENFLFDNANQKIQIIKNAYENTDGKIPIIFAINGDETNYIIDQINDLGKKFDKLNFILAPPFSEKMASNDLKSFFETILNSVNPKNHIYLYNNPNQFFGNEIEPKILNDLIIFPNLRGIVDASKKINIYKAYIQLLNENFAVYCSNASKFSTFLQLIPLKWRKYSGIVPSISNLVNICAKLYKASLEDKILNLVQLQEQLNDIRDKIYFKFEKGEKYRAIKYAFLYLYKDLLSINIEDFYEDLDDVKKGIIEATVKYMINQKFIYQLYPLKKRLYHLKDLINIFSDIDVLNEQGKIKKIIGPLDAKINTIYRVNFQNNKLIFRFRTSKSFQYENIIKEKILFPLLNGYFYPFSSKIREKIKEIVINQKGNYFFNKEKPPIIPIANLIYYDETKKRIPYLFSIQDYISGKPLSNILTKIISEELNLNVNLNTSKFVNLFKNLGEILSKLHEIKFDSFYEIISDIGSKRKKEWTEIFNLELDREIQQIKRNKLEYIKEIRDYFKDNESLIEEENEPVLLHNDFQGQNIIAKEEGFTTIRISGLIDFDNWRIGVRALDFVKIYYWVLNCLKKPQLIDAFNQGYMKCYKYTINNDFKKKIELYSLLWFLKMYNFKYYEIKKLEQKKTEDIEFSSADIYINEIKKILSF
ncbi:MAG: dihydrodipicolinate synthase family protein [Promethearchaeota archaeon]